jgi:hypothetical protein
LEEISKNYPLYESVNLLLSFWEERGREAGTWLWAAAHQLFLDTKYDTTLSISISVTNLCVSSMCIASSFCLRFAFKSRSNLSASLGAF